VTYHCLADRSVRRGAPVAAPASRWLAAHRFDR